MHDTPKSYVQPKEVKIYYLDTAQGGGSACERALSSITRPRIANREVLGPVDRRGILLYILLQIARGSPEHEESTTRTSSIITERLFEPQKHLRASGILNNTPLSVRPDPIGNFLDTQECRKSKTSSLPGPVQSESMKVNLVELLL